MAAIYRQTPNNLLYLLYLLYGENGKHRKNDEKRFIRDVTYTYKRIKMCGFNTELNSI